MNTKENISERLDKVKEADYMPLTPEDRERVINNLLRSIENKDGRINSLKFFIYGILIGILGGYFSNLIYDISKNTSYFIPISFLMFMILSFSILIFLSSLSDQKREINSLNENIQLWNEAKGIRFGEKSKVINRAEFKIMKKRIKQAKTKEEKEKIYRETFQIN